MAEQPSIGGQEAVTGVALANLSNGWKPVRFFGLVLVIGFSIAQLSLVFDRIHRITPSPSLMESTTWGWPAVFLLEVGVTCSLIFL